jgi:hypothetical protein
MTLHMHNNAGPAKEVILNKPQLMKKIMKEEYEDGCRHQLLVIVIPSSYEPECEGAAGIAVKCGQCDQVLESSVIYE